MWHGGVASGPGILYQKVGNYAINMEAKLAKKTLEKKNINNIIDVFSIPYPT